MKLWEIALTIYCFINVGFNFILLTLNLQRAKIDKEYTEKHLQMGQDICDSNEQLMKISELEKQALDLITKNASLTRYNEHLREMMKDK